MAIINLSVSVNDSDLPRLFTALRATWGADLTEEQLTEGLRQHGITLMKTTIKTYEKKLAQATADALDPAVDIV